MSEKDPLAALASITPESLKSRACLAARTIDALGETRGKVLRFLIEESGHSSANVARACRESGVRIAEETIRMHRRKACTCPSE